MGSSCNTVQDSGCCKTCAHDIGIYAKTKSEIDFSIAEGE